MIARFRSISGSPRSGNLVLAGHPLDVLLSVLHFVRNEPRPRSLLTTPPLQYSVTSPLHPPPTRRSADPPIRSAGPLCHYRAVTLVTVRLVT
jgi:hypothetical protein